MPTLNRAMHSTCPLGMKRKLCSNPHTTEPDVNSAIRKGYFQQVSTGLPNNKQCILSQRSLFVEASLTMGGGGLQNPWGDHKISEVNFAQFCSSRPPIVNEASLMSSKFVYPRTGPHGLLASCNSQTGVILLP